MPGRWGAFLADTMTGQRLTDLRLVDGGSWSIELNGVPEGEFTVRDRDLDSVDPRQWGFLRGSVYFTYTSWDVDKFGRRRDLWSGVWCGGPIISAPAFDRRKGTSTFSWAGIRHMLAGRLVLPGDWDHPGEDNIRRATWARSGMSLGTIAQEIVKAAQSKPNGTLPITLLDSLRQSESSDADHTRTYEGFNLANITADKLLTELTEVIGGPDMAFRPRWVDDKHRAVTNDFWHGTEDQPLIPTAFPFIIDTTTSNSDVAAVSVTASNEQRTTRAYATGAGDGEGIALQLSTNREQLDNGQPMWETVQSYQSVVDNDTLYAHAVADNDRGAKPVWQMNLTMSAANPAAPMGAWQVGDTQTVITKGERVISDGAHQVLITKASGSFTSDMVQLELQEA